MTTSGQVETVAKRYGFSLQSVCWGYRDIFREAIGELLDSGVIGRDRETVSREFFTLLNEADRSCFDHVLKEFLGALNPQTRWITGIPAIFSDITELGRELAQSRVHHGVTFFRILGEGGLGATPDQVRTLVSAASRLRSVDDELAMAFIRGYGRLVSRLRLDEIDRFVNEGLRIYNSNPARGFRFMEADCRAAENVIRTITRECRLDDVKHLLRALLAAMTGRAIEIGDLGCLDADPLVERGTRVVCLYRWLYLPPAIRMFDSRDANRSWYLLMTLSSAAMLCTQSFPAVHGHPDHNTCRDLTGPDPRRANLFMILELVRCLRWMQRAWPGAVRLVQHGIDLEFRHNPPATDAEHLLAQCLQVEPGSPAARAVREAAAGSVNLFDSRNRLAELERICATAFPGLGVPELRPLAFVTDFLYPAEVGTAHPDSLVADLKEEAKRRETDTRADRDARTGVDRSDATAGGGEPADEPGGAPSAAFVYDEWAQPDNSYREHFCLVHEMPRAPRPGSTGVQLPDTRNVQRVRRLFERLKPDLVRKEKHLAEGDIINHDRLVDYLVRKEVEPSPRIDFYEKPLTSRRDLAVLILLDVSGSTGEAAGGDNVLDVEKHAALIFGTGLHALGDRFSICAFSGNGPRQCEFYVYKTFDEPWDRAVVKRLYAARPSNATRIGAALRHAGYRLRDLENRHRLIILITDGKPMDTDYDPHTRYAQYDVRKACEENARHEITTFAISTRENTRADMELMFPRRRFIILSDIAHLPQVLPRLYLRLTL